MNSVLLSLRCDICRWIRAIKRSTTLKRTSYQHRIIRNMPCILNAPLNDGKKKKNSVDIASYRLDNDRLTDQTFVDDNRDASGRRIIFQNYKIHKILIISKNY